MYQNFNRDPSNFNLNDFLTPLPEEKHKVFTSYYHYDDQWYKENFIQTFGHLFIDKSVGSGDISTDVSADYIKTLIQSSSYLRDASVTVVLCGPNTKKRKHVDWEISGTLDSRLNSPAGLVGILLPEFPFKSREAYGYDDLPQRLADNVRSGFARVYFWSSFASSDNKVKEVIEEAFRKRTQTNLIDNSRLQMQRNLS
jgi:hypothetical protein